jgi:hypothetical protein
MSDPPNIAGLRYDTASLLIRTSPVGDTRKVAELAAVYLKPSLLASASTVSFLHEPDSSTAAVAPTTAGIGSSRRFLFLAMHGCLDLVLKEFKRGLVVPTVVCVCKRERR